MAQKQHYIDGSKARLMMAAINQVQALEHKAAQLMHERNELAAALRQEAEAVLARPLPEPVTFGVDDGQVIVGWDDDDIPI